VFVCRWLAHATAAATPPFFSVFNGVRSLNFGATNFITLLVRELLLGRGQEIASATENTSLRTTAETTAISSQLGLSSEVQNESGRKHGEYGVVEHENGEASEHAEGLQGYHRGRRPKEESNCVGEGGNCNGRSSMRHGDPHPFDCGFVDVSLVNCIAHHEHVVNANAQQ